MMRQKKLCWRRYAAGELLLACGVTEGRMEVVVVEPEAMMMDGSSRLVTCYENCCVVLVGWMHWCRQAGRWCLLDIIHSILVVVVALVLMDGIGQSKARSLLYFYSQQYYVIYNTIVSMLLKFPRDVLWCQNFPLD
jgi:hypothetical protein